MSLSLDAYRAKLVIKILYSKTAEDVERYIETAIRALRNRKVNGYIIARFLDKIFNQFEVIHASAPAEQITNIMEAKACLNRIKEELTAPVS